MTAGLKEIWKNAFGDPDWYIDFFFKNRFEAENTFVYLDGGKPVSMFFMLPAQINVEGSFKNAGYIYGVSTMPTYQGRGYSTALLRYANDNMADNIEATFLTPASSGLFNFYKKQGYEAAFAVKEMDLSLQDFGNIQAPAADFKKIDAKSYKAVRDRAFNAHGYIKWDASAIEYILAENELVGGKAYGVYRENSENIILYRIWDKKLIVKETTLDGDLLFGILKQIMVDENVSACNVRLHPQSKINCEAKDFAMIYGGEKIKNGYFNLVLD